MQLVTRVVGLELSSLVRREPTLGASRSQLMAVPYLSVDLSVGCRSALLNNEYVGAYTDWFALVIYL